MVSDNLPDDQIEAVLLLDIFADNIHVMIIKGG